MPSCEAGCRSEKSIFKAGLFTNKWSIGAFVAGVFFLAFVLFVPFMHKLFMVTPLVTSQVLSIVGLAFIPTVLVQVFKVIRDCVRKK